MNSYIKALQDHNAENAESVLDLLYAAYTERDPIDSQTMRRNFAQLDQYLKPLPEEVQNAVFQIFCNIYTDNERIAFQKGLCVGVKLSEELK